MEAFPIVSVCDVNAFIAGDGVSIYDERRMDTVLPLFLHLNRTRSQHCLFESLRDDALATSEAKACVRCS